MSQILSIGRIVELIERPDGEQELYEAVEALRERTVPMLGEAPIFKNEVSAVAIEQGVKLVGEVLDEVLVYCDPTGGDAGHGPGHWCRDFVHTLRLAHDKETSASAIVPMIVAGALHDIGTLFVDRYADRDRAVRHAEIGALLILAALRGASLSDPEKDLCAYAVAAHTHYLQTQEVKCADGATRQVNPWLDMADDKPVLPIWMPRWADRLDCNGPCFIGRHFLTLNRDHHDFGTEGFYAVSFAEHMKPFLRSNEEIKEAGGKCTMLEHVRMFAGSQTDGSVYGRHDRGKMRVLRDEYRDHLEHIIGRVAKPTDVNVERMLQAWTRFLSCNIEPLSDKAKWAAHDLARGFKRLDADTQHAWACGFRASMAGYLVWADSTMSFLNELPSAELRMKGVTDDVRRMIQPNPSWVKLLAG